MSYNQSFKIRPMEMADLEHAFGLSKTEGWNQTEEDWKLLFENPRNTCLVAEKDKLVVGTATAINYANKMAWIGMVLVDKKMRGQGIGRMLVTDIIDELTQIESLKLDATPAGVPLYKSLGFKEEYLIERMTCNSVRSEYVRENEGKPVHAESESFSEIIKHDKHFFGADRSSLLEALYKNYPEKAFVLKQNNKIEGYIFGRIGIHYDYLGPVFACSPESAKMLISAALKTTGNQPVAVDVPQDKADLIQWLESACFVKQRQFTRMYLKNNPFPGIIKNQYLIGGPEYG